MGNVEDKSSPGVSIVIPTWEGKELLRRFLPSVLKAARVCGRPWEAIVYDDHSSDSTVDFLRKHFPQVRVLRTKVRRGFAGASNAGFRESRYEIVVLLNNDTDVDEHFLKPLLDHFENENVFAVVCKCYDWDGKMFRDGGKIGEFKRGFFRIHRNYDVEVRRIDSSEPYYSFHASGAFSAFSRKKLEALGGFDELFVPFNWEDADLSYRAWKRGWEIHYEPTSIVRHRPNTTVGRFRKAYVKAVSRRNRLLFIWKNLSDVDKLVQHCLFLLFQSMLAFLRLDLTHFASLGMAIAKLSGVSKARREEKMRIRRSDTEVLSLLRDCYQRPEVVIVE
ncbi:glycosyltransferase family 2 protein [candidate division TA06 bacterium]|uniref:Glycosyltransferase family 2 protein n=1 Tax=candidate division TA06 bacterium TaxID=2250710 RepID=A0A523UXK9_UNCT6|nr:MAG: glycosyltransferase family 2 protein [candidate division TA06 bacterium]